MISKTEKEWSGIEDPFTNYLYTKSLVTLNKRENHEYDYVKAIIGVHKGIKNARKEPPIQTSTFTVTDLAFCYEEKLLAKIDIKTTFRKKHKQ